MPYCQQFKAEIQKWEKELEEAKVLLGEYLESGEEEKRKEIRDRLERIISGQREFSDKDYKNYVLEMLCMWYSGSSIQKNLFMEQVNFDEQGRILIKNSLTIPRSSSVEYFPALIKKIEKDLFLSDTHIDRVIGVEEVGRDLQLLRSFCKSMPQLKKVGGSVILGPQIESFEKLEKVGGSFLAQSSCFKFAPCLQEIGRLLNLYNVSISSFKKSFPLLKKIGKDDYRGWSIEFAYEDQNLKEEVERLVNGGLLKIEGEIGFEY